jgi:hypothetical protein
MSLVLEAGATPLITFTVPYKGTNNSIAAHQITPDTLYSSMNVFIRRGKLRERPGLTLLNNTVFDNAVIGGAMAVTPAHKILLAFTRSQLYTLLQGAGAWSSDTLLPFSNSDADPVDITFLETMSQYVAIIANISFPLKVWREGVGVTPIIAANVPTAKSVCTAASRIVALVDPHTLQWSATLDYQTWPALAIAKIAQTNDTAICIRSLTTLDFVIYKERSIYVAKSQPGSDATAFNIQFIQTVEGPAGTLAVVDIDSGHMYMTKSGRVGIFDGSQQVQWIADGLWVFLQSDIDPQYAGKIFGVYDYRLHTVTFWYPRRGDEGMMHGMLLINLPLQGSGVEPTVAFSRYVSSAFLGVSNEPCSAAFESRFNDQIDTSVIFTASPEAAASCFFDDTSPFDNSIPYQCSFQTQLFPLPSLKHSQITLEAYLERQNGNGTVNVNAVTSDALENEAGTVSDIAEVIDLNSNPVREYIAFNIPTRFFGLKYSWSSENVVRYAGTTLHGRVVS